ncbi:HAMP domain-containing histidine kinase [Synechococcus sp. FGCU-3]|nr:HAMP domain-containing histidine kinase [Synechococcus sp. FGCU3]
MKHNQRWNSLGRDISRLILCCATTTSLTILVGWRVSTPWLISQNIQEIEENAARYEKITNTGGIALLREIHPELDMRETKTPEAASEPQSTVGRSPSSPKSFLLIATPRLVETGLIRETHASSQPNTIWIRLKVSALDEPPLWLRQSSDLTQRPAWRTLKTSLLALGITLGSLLFILVDLIWPLAQALRNLPSQLTRRMSLANEEGSGLARSILRKLNTFIDGINQASENQRMLLRGLTHDLRSPLSRLLLRVEQLTDPQFIALSTEVEIIREVEDLQFDLQHLSEISNRIYAYADSLSESAERQSTSLDELLRRIGDSYSDNEVVVRSDRVICSICSRAMQRCINNLVDNAIEYGKPPVLIGCKRINGKILVTVEDHGSGMKADSTLVMPRQVPASDRNESKHRGLGLGIVEEFCRANGGYLRLRESNLGGLRAEMWLKPEQR